jgi:hypothetical protein
MRREFFESKAKNVHGIAPQQPKIQNTEKIENQSLPLALAAWSTLFAQSSSSCSCSGKLRDVTELEAAEVGSIALREDCVRRRKGSMEGMTSKVGAEATAPGLP